MTHIYTLVKQEPFIRGCLLFTNTLPALYLLWQYKQNQLGINPFATLNHLSAHWAMFFLLLTLAITPLRRWLTAICKAIHCPWGKRLVDWNFLMKGRRQLGIFSVVYACIHTWTYLYLEQDWQLNWILEDIQDRLFIAIGFICLLTLCLLLSTSLSVIQHKMGAYWHHLHRWVMPLTVLLAITHHWLATKVDDKLPSYYLILFSIFLGHRLAVTFIEQLHRTDDNETEAKR